jgi:ketosteroid isomerase-like protein
MFEALKRNDEEALLALADAEVEIHPSRDSLSNDIGRGHEEFAKFWREWPSFWDAYHLEPRDFVHAGDQVVVVLYERARSRPGAPEIEDEFAHVWTVRAGKVTRVEVYSHKAEALRAAGVRD